MAIAHRRLTLEQFLELPEEKPALEYAGGVVTRKMSPQSQHGRLQARFIVVFELSPDAGQRLWVFTETRVTFAGASFVPDAIVVARDRIPRDRRGRPENRFRFAPDIAVEIRSPGQSLAEQIERCQWYVDHGVKVALLADPDDDSIRLFRPGEPHRLLRGADRIDLGPVLPDLQLTVQELFDSLELD
jgi:Uma2 family endonuclease